MILDKTLETAGDSINEQARTIVKRYNLLATNIVNLEKDFDKKTEIYQSTKMEIEQELLTLKQRIVQITEQIKKVDEYKKNLARDFRYIIKIDSMNKITRRVDKLKYEEFVVRDELYRLIEEKFK
ncbi:hypothetical protein COV13_02650 [Candidatus Woesearchaeota archaeon CG10_big_fil_rev_8_21_14_0_10_32_9]|nr:MAG: hypothetical protein COV13_02650 [Candidatus Woesearchaeota archaeon CG10_big_fil_rev_8_21_14_0_10_32_9]